jgi:hypothetical protein
MPTITELISLGWLIENKVAHEISLIGHRMTWLVVSESFLFSAFAAILTSTPHMTRTADMLLGVIPILGILIIVLVWPSLIAARAVLQALLDPRGDIEDSLKGSFTGIKIPNLGAKSREDYLKWTRWAGDLSIFGVPLTLLIAWGATLYIRTTLTVTIVQP